MTMANVFMVLFPVLGTLMAMVCCWLLFEALSPTMIGRARERYRQRPMRTFFLGCAIAVPVFFVGIALANAPGGGAKLLGITVLVLLITTGLAGSTGLARHIGCNLGSACDEAQPWRRVYRGAVILAIAFLMPMVGWFLILPVTLLSGVGAAALSIRTPKPKAEPAPLMDAGTPVQA